MEPVGERFYKNPATHLATPPRQGTRRKQTPVYGYQEREMKHALQQSGDYAVARREPELCPRRHAL